MTTESTFDTIRRLQQQVDCIDAQIVAKQSRIKRFGYKGPLGRMIENEIQDLQERRTKVCNEILELKNLKP